jgi:hypothetical protein
MTEKPIKKRKKSSENLERQNIADDRVGELLDLIAQGVHMGRPTLKRKAREWGVSLSAAEGLSARAYQVVRLRYSKDKTLRAQILSRVEAIVNLALAKTRLERRKNRSSPTGYDDIQVPDPDFQSALQGLKLVGMELGMFEPRVHITIQTLMGQIYAAAEKELGPEKAEKVLAAMREVETEGEDVELPDLEERDHDRQDAE